MFINRFNIAIEYDWRNGSASDSRSEGSVFKSRRVKPFGSFFYGHLRILIRIFDKLVNFNLFDLKKNVSLSLPFQNIFFFLMNSTELVFTTYTIFYYIFWKSILIFKKNHEAFIPKCLQWLFNVIDR